MAFSLNRCHGPILGSFNLSSVFSRQKSEKEAYKPGLDYLLECFLPSTFCPNHQRFARKNSKISETGGRRRGGAPAALVPRPARLRCFHIVIPIERQVRQRRQPIMSHIFPLALFESCNRFSHINLALV